MRNISDHNPIWIISKEINWDPKPFKFFLCWIDHHDFLSFVKSLWDSNEAIGKRSYVLKENFKLFKIQLRL